jgi:hypothetical protein
MVKPPHLMFVWKVLEDLKKSNINVNGFISLKLSVKLRENLKTKEI